MMGLVITTAAQGLAQDGIDPTTAWADDPGITPIQAARLRAMGRSETARRYQERGQYINTAGQGMGADGRQKQVTPTPRPTPAPVTNPAPSQTPAAQESTLTTGGAPFAPVQTAVVESAPSITDLIMLDMLTGSDPAPAIQTTGAAQTVAPSDNGGGSTLATAATIAAGLFLL